MLPGPRYAVFYVPEPGSLLAAFGRKWLGHDPESGKACAHEPMGLPRHISTRLVETPARYGLHGTLVAPFALNDGVRPDHLAESLAAVAGRHGAARLPAMGLVRLGTFLALLPGDQTEVARLARTILFATDRFRAAPGGDEMRRREAAGLTRYQRVLLATYGYPYVMDEYRFHITLTGPLGGDETALAERALGAALAGVIASPLTVGSICLMIQSTADARFRVLSRWRLSAA